VLQRTCRVSQLVGAYVVKSRFREEYVQREKNGYEQPNLRQNKIDFILAMLLVDQTVFSIVVCLIVGVASTLVVGVIFALVVGVTFTLGVLLIAGVGTAPRVGAWESLVWCHCG
jgi:hypothetical protein